MIVGLTGTFGSGKSSVARMFEEAGARVIDADRIAAEIVAPGGEALDDIVREFGAEILASDGALDRKAMGWKVFNDPEARARLNAITHPRIRRRELELIERHRAQGADLIVLDVPLLFENGADAICDVTVVVTVDEPSRLKRLTRSRGLTPEDIARRMAAQMPQDQKVLRADHVIDNSGSFEDTREQVRRLIQTLQDARQPSQSSRM